MLHTWINGVHNRIDATERNRVSAELAALDEVQGCLLKDFAANMKEFLVWVRDNGDAGYGEMMLVRVERLAGDNLRAVLIAQTRM